MNASHEGRVRALDERTTFVVHQVSMRDGPSGRQRRGDFVITPLDVLRAVANALAHDQSDLVHRDGCYRAVDSQATSRCELNGEHAQIATDRQRRARDLPEADPLTRTGCEPADRRCFGRSRARRTKPTSTAGPESTRAPYGPAVVRSVQCSRRLQIPASQRLKTTPHALLIGTGSVCPSRPARRTRSDRD